MLASNLDMFILFLSYYEASGRRIDGSAIDEIIDDLYRQMKFLNVFMDINRRPFLAAMRKYLYKSYRGYAAKVAAKRRRGEWLDTWGMIVDPNKTDEGFAFTLVGCPITEYAKNTATWILCRICALSIMPMQNLCTPS